MAVRDPAREDLRLLVTIAAFLIVGAMMTIAGLWAIIDDWQLGAKGVIGMVILGPALLLVAAGELVHRVRNGRQAPGRRVRDR